MHCLWAMTYALFIYVLLLLQTELLVILHITTYYIILMMNDDTCIHTYTYMYSYHIYNKQITNVRLVF